MQGAEHQTDLYVAMDVASRVPKRRFLVALELGSEDSEMAAMRAVELANAERNDEIVILSVVHNVPKRYFGLGFNANDEHLNIVQIKPTDQTKRSAEAMQKDVQTYLAAKLEQLRKMSLCKASGKFHLSIFHERKVIVSLFKKSSRDCGLAVNNGRSNNDDVLFFPFVFFFF
jgi:hypothetical protein